MELLVINGSPKKENSNTMKLTHAFIHGLETSLEFSTTIISLYDETINHCRGCYCCWRETPGECVLKDDAKRILDAYTKADIVIWSTPIHTFGMSSLTKTLFDRFLPFYLPQIEMDEATHISKHPLRHDMKTKNNIVIATCGFPDIHYNAESFIKHFDIFFHLFKEAYDCIVCPQGDIFGLVYLRHVTEQYLDLVTQAGQEYGGTRCLSDSTIEQLKRPLISYDDYVTVANLNWIPKNEYTSIYDYNAKKAKNCVRQMQLIYQAEYMKADSGILEIDFDDGAYVCQMILTKECCTIVDDRDVFHEYNLKISTGIDDWMLRAKKASAPSGSAKSEGKQKSQFQLLTEMVSSLALNSAKRELSF